MEDIAAAAQAAVGTLAGRYPLQALLAVRAGATLRPVRPARPSERGAGAGEVHGRAPVLAGQHEGAMSAWLASSALPRPVLMPAGPGDGTAGTWDGQGVLLCPLPVPGTGRRPACWPCSASPEPGRTGRRPWRWSPGRPRMRPGG